MRNIYCRKKKITDVRFGKISPFSILTIVHLTMGYNCGISFCIYVDASIFSRPKQTNKNHKCHLHITTEFLKNEVTWNVSQVHLSNRRLEYILV